MKRRDWHTILLNVDAVLKSVGRGILPDRICARDIAVIALLAYRELTHFDVVWCVGREMSRDLLSSGGGGSNVEIPSGV